MSADELNIQQYKKMTETPIPKLILGLAAPTILSMLITSIYNLADTFFVGQISTSASGAVGIVSSLTGFELTRGVLCAFRRPLPCSVEEVCRNARRVAVLEGIVDSTNVGAIFRSAAALNMDAVLVTPSCCDPLCRRAVRVSMGTVFQVPWAQIGICPADWPENGIAQLHSLGFKTAAMALSDRSVSIDDSALSAEPKLAIVLGTEGDGLAHSTIAACDYTVKIPMSHGVDSLNVAAASAVAFWQLGNR